MGTVSKARPPVMADVARAAGVSHMTVSRVLNDHPSVRGATRQRVLDAIDELGYRPNAAARTLAGRRSGILGVVALESTLFGPTSTLYAIERSARAAGFAVTITVPDGPLPEAIERLARQGAEGVVVIAPLVSEMESIAALPGDLPIVVVEGGVGLGRPVVAVDQLGAAAAVTTHLLEQGASTVVHVAGPDDWYEARARIEGWRRALREAGAVEHDVLRGDWSAASGYDCGRTLAGRRDVEAVFVANDQMALGLLRALREAGVDVPGQVLVAGFDDLPESSYFTPPLTTVRQDFDAVGTEAIALLLAELDDGRGTPASVTVAAELVVRASSLRPESPPSRRGSRPSARAPRRRR